MSNKSGFELRADLLCLAQGILDSNREQFRDQWFQQTEEERTGTTMPVIPITSEEVIIEARKLNAFVIEK